MPKNLVLCFIGLNIPAQWQLLTEALRLQLDNLQKERQELEARNLKLSENPSKEVLRDTKKERDHWKGECKNYSGEWTA